MTDDEVRTQLDLLAAHRRTLAVYLHQLANLGADYAPPGVHNGITEAREQIASLKAELRAAGVMVADDLQDDARPSSLLVFAPTVAPVVVVPPVMSSFEDAGRRISPQTFDFPTTFYQSTPGAPPIEDVDRARLRYERALAVGEQVLGPTHPRIAPILNNLAYLLNSQGHHTAARPLYERALTIVTQTLGPAHPNTQAVQRNLAVLNPPQSDPAK